MDAREYLNAVRRAEEELTLLCTKKQHYEELAGLTGARISAPEGRSGNVSSVVENAAVNIADLTTEIDVITSRYVTFIQKAQKLLDEVPVFNFRKLLTLKYFLGKSWADVTKEMDFKDSKSVYRVHGYALTEFQKVLTNHHID